LDLVAPTGDVNLLGDVRTTDRIGGNGYEAGNYTTRFGGTSAACPQVSGVVALMLSIRPDLTETQIRTILQQTATDMGSTGFDNTFGFGRLNAFTAIQTITPVISGTLNVCSTGATYTVNNLPTGSSLTWSYSSNLQAYYGGSNYISLRAISNGSAWVQASINGNCSTLTLPKMNLIAGYPTPTFFVSQHSGEGEPLEVLFRANPYLAGAANTYHWYVNNTLEESNLDYNEFIRYVPCNQTLNVKSKLSNSCGTSGFSSTAVVSGDCSSPKSLTINPNPVAETMVVSISSTSESDTTNAKLLLTSINTTEKESVLYAVSLTDFMGTVVFSTTFIDAYFTIPVSKIDNGNYILTVTEGSNKYQKTVVIKH
jgi:hypothetical protein